MTYYKQQWRSMSTEEKKIAIAYVITVVIACAVVGLDVFYWRK